VTEGRLGDIRAPWLWRVLIVLSLLVAVWVLYITSYKTFFYDEWDFIVQNRPWDLNLMLQAHNEHWVTIPILVWKVLFVLFGIRSYVPYEAALLAVHAAAVLLMFQFVRRHSGEVPAFGAALILLVLGGGGMDIVWAFQIQFIGSVAFGLLAMLLIEDGHATPVRLAGSSGALLGSLMCSGVGVAFLAATAALIVFDRDHRRYFPALIVPTLAFVTWFAFYGAGLPGTPGAPCPTCAPSGFQADVHRGPVGFEYLGSLALFVVYGVKASLAALFAAEPDVGTILLPVAAVSIGIQLYRTRRMASWRIAMLVGVVGWFTLVGLGRSSRGPNGAEDSHYLYIGAVFLLPLVADAVRDLPWRGFRRPGIAIVFAFVVFFNAWVLRDVALSQTDLMQTQIAKLQTVAAFRGALDMDLDRSLDEKVMPQLKARTYLAAIKDLGSPVPASTPSFLSRLPHKAVDEEMVNLFGSSLSSGRDPGRPVAGMPCQTVDSSAGSTLDFTIPQAESLELQSSKGGSAFLFLGFVDPPPSTPLKRLALPPSTPMWIHLPNTGLPVLWQLRVQTLDVGSLRVCSNVTPRISRPDRFYAELATATLGSGWSSVPDPAADSGKTAKAMAGTAGPEGIFTNGFVPTPSTYDLWFRIRVTKNSGQTPEMTLGVVDVDANNYISSTAVGPYQFGSAYKWVLVAANVKPTAGHVLRFQANVTSKLSTDWYLAEALMVAAGSAPP
jgi:hypothetical protein